MNYLDQLFKATVNSISSTSTIPFVNPTEIYNEGWMTRFLVHYSLQQKIKIGSLIDFGKIKNATSEGLISSPFVKAEINREGYTHADMALGDFSVNYEERGEITVEKNASIFGIIEAKMKSNLSKGTTHAPDYNQASRNIVCIAHNTPREDCDTFFIVVAPEKMIKHHQTKEQLKASVVNSQIENRFEISELDVDEQIMQSVSRCKTAVLSYEEWIEYFKDKDLKDELGAFYKECLKWNRV
ncbi:hypothetical protein [Flammeovirga aprica]|uniref:Uncharacterized protein n=1 Tax=Flammeovirga aprica JL-4 TaxID=694437 RepID=A0A7X9RYF4_9BACT|nr:hypothetical protein [Flammeovirga aprica]NME70942.1 hypothetical protein [Flammeovirga aprica JL-4]